MTEDRASVDVAALLEERRRYEGWLAALEVRRERTPSHIFERVDADYRSRLQRVTEQLASHRSVLLDERAGIESRLSLIAAEAKMRGDEKAELELRYEVGETPASEAAGALQALTRTLEVLNAERQNLERRRSEIAELLAEKAAEERAAATAAKTENSVGEAASEAGIQEALARLEPKPEPAHATPIAPHPPIVLRPSSASEQTKSLKCSECGGMNYPTEWYCERCGAELAAL